MNPALNGHQPSADRIVQPAHGDVMPGSGAAATVNDFELAPRFEAQGYTSRQIAERRQWVEAKLGVQLRYVSGVPVTGEILRGNVENPIGCAQVPLGVAGPLLVRGEHAKGVFYVPLATTEGALVRSYERGMMAMTRAGGVEVRIHLDENRTAPVFLFNDVIEAEDFARRLPDLLDAIRDQAESTTRHGRFKRLECRVTGAQVIVTFSFATGDAQGMNMIVKATDQACRWIVGHTPARRYLLFSGLCSEKRASGALMGGGKGKSVVAGTRLPAAIVKQYLHVTPGDLAALWQQTVMGHLQAHAAGFNGQIANGLAALFISCGQDVANIANSAVGVTQFAVDTDGALYASLHLPSLCVATVGGGTGIGTSVECLRLLGCEGTGKSMRLAEIFAATLLAGELSMAAAIASGEIVAAHERFGRNRPA